MARLADHGDTARMQHFLEGLGNLLSEALLYLEAPRERINDARDLAQADNLRVGQICHVHFAEKGQQVMFTHAEKFYVSHDDDFVILNIEQSTIDDLMDVGGVTTCEKTESFFCAIGCAQKAFPGRVFAECL